MLQRNLECVRGMQFCFSCYGEFGNVPFGVPVVKTCLYKSLLNEKGRETSSKPVVYVII